MPRKRKYTVDNVSALLKKEGYTLLSDEVYNKDRKVLVRCPKGHEVRLGLSGFTNYGNRCFECHGSKKYTLNFVRLYAEGQGYILTSTTYSRAKDKLAFLCPQGHTYTASWQQFYYRKFRCSTCSGKAGFDVTRASAEFEKVGYTLISTDYTTSLKKLSFMCDKGHTHEMTLNNLMSGQRCGKCFSALELGRSSRPERELVQHYARMFSELVSGSRDVIKPYELDLYFPKHKVAVEYCGLYWHSDLFKDRNYHYKKMEMCRKVGIRLITIFEDEYINRPDVVLSRIDNALGVIGVRIYARSCTVETISMRDAYSFLDCYHLQGKGTAQQAYALLYKGNVVSVMSLGAVTRKHTALKGNVLELKRLASIPGTVVVGGASRLFKRAKNYALSLGCTDIRSYCDMRWGNNGSTVYDHLGFVKTNCSKYTPHYFKGQKRYRNFSLRKTPEERLTGETEYALRSAQGYKRIWDCGHATYNYKL